LRRARRCGDFDVAREKLAITPEQLSPYGHYKAKLSLDFIKTLERSRTASSFW